MSEVKLEIVNPWRHMLEDYRKRGTGVTYKGKKISEMGEKELRGLVEGMFVENLELRAEKHDRGS